MDKVAGTGLGDELTHCAGQRQMEGGERLAESSSPGLFLPCVSHKYHHLQRFQPALGLPDQVHTLLVTSRWGSSYRVAVSEATLSSCF